MVSVLERLIGTLSQMLGTMVSISATELDETTYWARGVSCIAQKNDSSLKPRLEFRSVVETILSASRSMFQITESLSQK
jgi:ABC-type dipeptide/oligopeptide/nickel transport system ATPase subunit